MSNLTTKRSKPARRKLNISVAEPVAQRLEAMAGKYSRYRKPGDVASEAVTLYLDLLEEVNEDVARFKQRQIRRERRRFQ